MKTYEPQRIWYEVLVIFYLSCSFLCQEYVAQGLECAHTAVCVLSRSSKANNKKRARTSMQVCGHIFICAQGCAPIRRRECLRRAAQRYQEGSRGACKHAARQRAWRCRHAQKVTHQASIAMVPARRVVSSSTTTPALEPHAETARVKPPPLAPRCCFCGGMLGAFARLGALGRRP